MLKGLCGGNFTTKSGVLTSPSYPNGYAPGDDCTYKISQSSGMYLQLTFLLFDLEVTSWDFWDGNNHQDVLEIRDGSLDTSPLVGRFYGANVPLHLRSTQNYVWIRYREN